MTLLCNEIKSAVLAQYQYLRQPGNRFDKLNIVDEILPNATEETLPFDASGVDKSQTQKKLIDFVRDDQNQSFLFIGEGGIGKTTTVFHILENYYYHNDVETQIPLYLELNKCPIDVSSWCIDDKNTLFVLKSVAEIVTNRKIVDLHDEILLKLQEEFQKKPSDIPQYVFLLDGLNEVSSAPSKYGKSPKTLLAEEIQDLLQRYTNVRFIITSRNDATELTKIDRINILGVSKETILDFICKPLSDSAMAADNRKKLSDNKQLLDCLRVPLFLCMYIKLVDVNVCTRGEILRDFFQTKRKSLYSTEHQLEGNIEYSIILDFIIPVIAWNMYKKDSFGISRNFIAEIISDLFIKTNSSILNSKYTPTCFELSDDIAVGISKLSEDYSVSDTSVVTKIINSILSELAIMYENRGEYSFKHHHFRDFFAAVHLINTMKMMICLNNNKDEEVDAFIAVLKNHKLNQTVLDFLSESLDVHYTNPKYENGRWTHREWDARSSLICESLDLFRSNNDASNAVVVWNIVHIIISSGMGVLDIDLSDLDLTAIDFNGVLCGIDSEENELSAIFDDSLIDFEQFFPQSHNEIVDYVTYNFEGNRILTLSNSSIILWDNKYNCVHKWEGQASSFVKASLSFDNHFIVCLLSDGSLVRLDAWDFSTDPIIIIDSGVQDFCVSSKENNIYCSTIEKTICIIDVKSLHSIKKLRMPEMAVRISYRSNDNVILAETAGNNIYTVALHTNRKKQIASGVFIAVTNQGNRWGYIGNNNHIVFNDISIDLSEYIDNLTIEELYISPDGSHIGFITGGNTLHIYDIEHQLYKRPLTTAQKITAVTFSNDNKYVVTCSGDLFARIWEIKTNVGLCIKPLGDIADWIRNAYYSPKAHVAAAASIDGTAKIWDLDARVIKKVLYGHEDRVTSVTYNHKGDVLVTTSDDCSIKLWDSVTGGCTATLCRNSNSVHNADFSPDDSHLATISWDKTGSVWDLETLTSDVTLIGHTEPILTIKYSPDGSKLVTASNDNSAILWDASSGQNLGIRAMHSTRLNGADFNPTGDLIITSAFDYTARVWYEDHFEEVSVLEGHTDSVRGATFNATGDYIGTVSRDTSGRIWEWKDNRAHLKAELYGHTFFVRSSMFNNINNLLTSSYDGTIREWDLEGNNINTIYCVPGIFVCGCDFSNAHIIKGTNSNGLIDILKSHGAIV